MSENDNRKNIFHDHLLSGWKKMFGRRVESIQKDISNIRNTTKERKTLKPFPQNHFFSPEELLFLSNNQDQCTLLQRWALEMSKWAKEKCNDKDKSNPQFFPSVQWQDGLLSAWIDSKLYSNDIDQQADRLYQLQLEGYELDDTFKRMIEARACRTLVGNLFVDERKRRSTSSDKDKHYFWIKGIIDKSEENLSLSVYHYNKVSHKHDKESIISYKQLKSLIDAKELVVIGNEGQRKWNEEATIRDLAEKKYTTLIALIKRNNLLQGMFPANNSISVRIDNKDYYPKAWKLSDDKIQIDFSKQTAKDKYSYIIEYAESYLFVELLGYIEQALKDQDVNQYICLLVQTFGKEIDENKVLSSTERPFLNVNGITIDSIIVKPSNEIIALNSYRNERVMLTTLDKEMMLKGVIYNSDSLLKELKSALLHTQDKITKELLQDKLDHIHQRLSTYSQDNRSLEELWQSILSRFNITSVSIPTFPKVPTFKVEDDPQHTEKKKGESIKNNLQGETDATFAQSSLPISTDKSKDSEDSTNQEGQGLPSEGELEHLPEGYIQIVPSANGRWHTAEMQRREAYRIYGKLLSQKLKKQLDKNDIPWVSKQMMIPRDIKGQIYTGANAIMLALWMEEKGFELPYFITEEELREKGYGIHQEAESLFVLYKEGFSRVYNIAQTSFPVTQRRAYESLKMNMVAMERKKPRSYQFLDADDFCKTSLQFDGTPGLSVYNYVEKVIHIAPKDKFPSEDDYYRDLAVAMIESTREVDFDSLRLDAYLFENLVSHLGSGIISQRCRFDATNPEYSRIWRERLENNPDYTKRILEQSGIASNQVLQASLS